MKGTTEIALDKLLLDVDNPRFGGSKGAVEQEEILKQIISQYGIDDLLGSIAKNGYFEAEPIICRPDQNGNYVVIEGNRRLSACLIITKDSRAKHHQNKSNNFNNMWEKSGSPRIDPIPCIVFDDKDRVFAYLGVRHISSAKEWDSYAKAAWLHSAINEHNFDMAQLSDMIGDTTSAVSKLVEAYNVVEQLIKAKKFNPENSQRKGRGSASAYPFSWVYTLLGNSKVRTFLKLSSRNRLEIHPLPENKLDDAKVLFDAMFGNKQTGRDSLLTDSRQLGLLADTTESSKKFEWLKSGKKVDEIFELDSPPEDFIQSRFRSVKDYMREIITVLAENELAADRVQTLELVEESEIALKSTKTAKNMLEKYKNSPGS